MVEPPALFAPARGRQGVSALEYALFASFFALATIGGINLLTTSIHDYFGGLVTVASEYKPGEKN